VKERASGKTGQLRSALHSQWTVKNGGCVSFQELIGWAASAVLVMTIVTQVYRQWQQGTSKGVSKWLFIGQMTASAGFLAYSWLIHDMVFLFTNALMVMSAAVGLGIVFWHRMKHADEKEEPSFPTHNEGVN